MKPFHFGNIIRHLDSTQHCIFVILLIISGIILPVSSSYSATLTGNDKYCSFSLQLQSSPYREQYIARLATDQGIMLAANTNNNSPEQSDAPALISIIVGSARSKTADSAIDAFSKDCLNCHDGSSAHNIEFNYTNSPGTASQQKYAGGSDHPNGMDYQSYVAFGRGKFKRISTFNSKMKFVNGKVGCLTCHNPLNPEKGHLVMSDLRSALCLTCHNK
jgi:predicted CXXCH cytochrome family protein